MAELETPAGFPDVESVEEGDKKKFLVETECTSKGEDGAMKWKVISIDGVKVDSDEEEDEELPDYDTSEDEPEGPTDSMGVGASILQGAGRG